MPSFCWGHLSPTPNCVLCGHGDVIHKRLSPAPKSGWAIRVPLPSEHRHEGQSAFFRQLSDQVEEKFFIGWFTQGSVGLELLEFSLTLTPLLERAWPGHKRRNRERGAVSQFSRSVVSDSATPWTAARQASLSFTISWSLCKLMPIELVMPSHPLSFLSPPVFNLS